MSKEGGLTFEAVCRMLVQARLLTPEQAREASIREDRERARIMRARAGAAAKRLANVDIVVHPAEILEAMQLGGLTEKIVMETIAKSANLPFVDLDPLKNFTTANFDFLQHYRPKANVVDRPHANAGGKGYSITGHHEIMVPLLAWAVLGRLDGR